MSKRDEAIRLRAEHLTYREIGEKLGVSKQQIGYLIKGRAIKPKPIFQTEVILRSGEVAKLLGIHVNTVRRWSDKGILKAYRITLRRDRRFKRKDVEKLLKAEKMSEVA